MASRRPNTITDTGWRADAGHALAAVGVIGLVTAACVAWLHFSDQTTIALAFLLIVLFVAASSRLWAAVVASVIAALAFDFFFLPPVGTFNIDDPEDWVALVAFIAVSFVASRLSSVAQGRERELGRLFDFSRDVLHDADGDAFRSLAERIAERFGLTWVAIFLPSETGFDRHEAGTLPLRAMPSIDDLHRAARATAANGGNITVITADEGHPVRLVPLRHRAEAVGVLAVAGRRIEPTTLNALANVVAIAIERVHLLEQRDREEASRRSVEIKSALLASFAHDLRTPLTAVRVAVSNLSESSLTEGQRAGQVDIALTGTEQLARLFQNIVDMARIDAGGITASVEWVHVSEIVEAARRRVEQALRAHTIRIVDRMHAQVVRVDPRLLSTALAHVLENAAQYSPVDSTITVTEELVSGGLSILVDDEGPGVAAEDLPHVFGRFFRGSASHLHASGTGMGLAIVQGMLNALGGRVTVENRVEGGARFAIVAPAESRAGVDE